MKQRDSIFNSTVTAWMLLIGAVGLSSPVASLGATLSEEIQRVHRNLDDLGNDKASVETALAIVKRYENEVGPLFINKATKKGFPREPSGDLAIHRSMFEIQQAIIDKVYTPENLIEMRQLLTDFKFKTSSYFPGAVNPPRIATTTHKLKVNASHPLAWGVPDTSVKDPARRPTGSYLAPGSVGLVAVPKSMINSGYSVRVGAHSWDLVKKPKVLRLDRVSIVYPITKSPMMIANPLGGGIYIEVPYGADAGVQTVFVRNAVRSPFFSLKSFNETSVAQWRKTERLHPGPWADFETEKFMMQVPSQWVRNYTNPLKAMKDWDAAMDGVTELFGYPPVRSKTVLYLQVDVTLRGSANYPGYPQSNYPYDPHKVATGKPRHTWMLKGPQFADWTVFHEVGHSQRFSKFRGEVEAVVNLPHVAIMNNKFGVNLDKAFGDSVSGKSQVSLDQAAITWMVTENFRQGKPMNHSNRPGDEFKYQHRGFGKYVDIAYLFGWDALSRFWRKENLRYKPGDRVPVNNDPIDKRILRLSKAAGADVTPLIHFWGIPPQNPSALSKSIRRAGLKPSRRIQERLEHYLSIIPRDNKAFRKHTSQIYPRGLGQPKNPLFGEGWYKTWLTKYDESHGKAAEKSLQKLIDLYFASS